MFAVHLYLFEYYFFFQINFQLCDLDNVFLVIVESTFNELPLDHLLNNTYISLNCRLIIAFGTSSATYLITEVYRLHKQAAFHHQTDYGYWNRKKDIINTLEQVSTNLYKMRNDLQNVSIRFGFGEVLKFITHFTREMKSTCTALVSN